MYHCQTTYKRKYEHTEQLKVFKIEYKLDEQLKGHVFSCFDKNDYMGLKQDCIEYTNILTQQVCEYVYWEFGDNMEELQNNAPDDMDKDADISRSSLKPF